MESQEQNNISQKEPIKEEEIPQIVTDYISGMTDQYAIDTYNELIMF